MIDTAGWIAIAAATLTGLTLLTFAGLRAWRDWLDVRRLEIGAAAGTPLSPPPTSSTRIELADLRERVRKLEAIAAGIEL